MQGAFSTAACSVQESVTNIWPTYSMQISHVPTRPGEKPSDDYMHGVSMYSSLCMFGDKIGIDLEKRSSRELTSSVERTELIFHPPILSRPNTQRGLLSYNGR